jgi:NAD-dependent dihydropyrimidine dehydrogenase PreA subunit
LPQQTAAGYNRPEPHESAMPRKLTVVISQGQSAHPAKRQLEEDIVAALLGRADIEVTIIPHLYDLQPDGTGVLCLRGIQGDMVVASWLYPRAAYWTLDRFGVRGHLGKTLLRSEGEEESDAADDSELDAETADPERSPAGPPQHGPSAAGVHDLPARHIFCLDLRAYPSAQTYVDEVLRIAQESRVQTVGIELSGLAIGGPAAARAASADNGRDGSGPVAAEDRILASGASNNGHDGAAGGADGEPPAHEPIRILEETGRRWYPVIDYSRCTNCMECLDFCLFGVYGVDRYERILVEQPDNCRKGCPACSRVCPENAIIFPQHKTPGIAGAPEVGGGAFKIDLSKLFGAPDDPLKTAVAERDEQLVLAGREAVGMTVGIPRRHEGKAAGPKDELDQLIDQLDELDL